MDRPIYWKHLAEEHGLCAVEFIDAGVEPYLIYEQVVIAGYFGRLHLQSQEPPPDLEAPASGTTCPDCGELAEGVTDFCAECEDRKAPRTLEGFLSYAASSTVNCK